MNTDPTVSPTIVACLDRVDGSLFRVGVTSHLLEPAMIDPLHVMLGVECGDWGVCLYLTVADAARLNGELGRLLDDLAERG
jgi:hypothetical protein